MRPTTLLCLLPFTALTACEVSLSGGSSGGVTATLQTELATAVQDELLGLAPALVVPGSGAPPGASLPAGCPAASSTTDSDGDGIPDDARLTFTNPPCSLSGFLGGTLTLDGTVRIQDPSGGNSTALDATLADLRWSYTDPGGIRSFTTTRNGTLNRLGSPDAALLAVNVTTVRHRPNRAAATIGLVGTLDFTAETPGSLELDQPLPAGDLTLDGTWTWRRRTEDYRLTVSTVVPLQYDPTCAGPHRFRAGRLELAGTLQGRQGTLVLTWSACGTDPARRWLESLT
ncbi:MAG TPA: hypothetical protein VNJ71_10965 [Gemmatimonadales bacterium]|nr:hypothetical protein [Gemmatimonadales bacterium]